MRISLLYCSIFLYLLCGYVATYIGIEVNSIRNFIACVVLATLGVEMIIILLSLLTRVSTLSLSNAKNTEDLIKKSYELCRKSLEKRMRVRWTLITIICIASMLVSAAYYIYLNSRMSPSQNSTANFLSVSIGVFDLGIFQFLLAIPVSVVKYMGYRNEKFHSLLKICDYFRTWKTVNLE